MNDELILLLVMHLGNQMETKHSQTYSWSQHSEAVLENIWTQHA